jgi:predicted secreted protein
MKTAVEWLFNQLSINNMALDKCTRAHQEMEQKILKKAKEMEKEQIMDAFNQGYREAELNFNNIVNKGDISEFYDAQNYYNETFNQQKQ